MGELDINPLHSNSDKGKEEYKFELKVTKPFHMKNLYKFLYLYMIEEGYRTSGVDSDTDEFPETYYDEWKLPQGHMERRIWWRFMMNPLAQSGNHSFRFYVDLSFRNLWLTNTETVASGKKVKVQDGEVSIIVSAKLKVLDDKIHNHPLLKYFYHFFRKRWFKHTYEGYRDELRHRMRKLQDAIKHFLDTVTYEEDQQNFHLDRGFEKNW